MTNEELLLAAWARKASENKENKGKITINDTEYSVRTSTTDAGAAGYITFVVSE